ncbi:MAG: CDP-alcohol phosphatidyltransferase family protein [Candidatus Komeilibacteria bacterium]
MNKFLSKINAFISRLNDWRDRWLQSKLRNYVREFKNRSIAHQEFWIEKWAQRIFGPLIDKEIITIPNIISFFRGVLALPLIIFILDERYLLTLLLFIFAALLDAIDGPLAKVLNQESSLGEILDPTGDKLIFGAILLPLGINYLHPLVFWFSLIAEIIAAIIGLFLRPLARKLGFDFQQKAFVTGKVKMLCQSLACGLMLLDMTIKANLITTTHVFFILSLPFAVASIISHLTSLKKQPR